MFDNLNYINKIVHIITNWHKIIDPVTVNLYCDKFINLHYSLLPSFGGLIGVAPVEKHTQKNVNSLVLLVTLSMKVLTREKLFLKQYLKRIFLLNRHLIKRSERVI